MAEYTADKLQIEIEGSSQSATRSINEQIKALEKLKSVTNGFKNPVSIMNSGGSSGKSGGAASDINKTTSALGRMKRAVSGIGSGAKRVSGLFSSLSISAGKTESSFGKLFSSIKRIAFYRVIRTIIKSIGDAFDTGIKNLYQYSRIMGTDFKKSMDSVSSSMFYFKNTMGAVSAPIIEVLTPAITYLIEKFVDLVNHVTEIIAVLRGQSTFTKAVRVEKEFAKATELVDKTTGKAANSLKRFLLGIDEINKTGEEGIEIGKLFEEVPVDTGLQEALGNLSFDPENVKETLDKIIQVAQDWIGGMKDKLNSFFDWLREKLNKVYDVLTTDGLREKIKGLGEALASALNEVTANIPWYEIGRTLGAGFDLALAFLVGFIYNYDWQALGNGLAQSLNGFVESVNWYEFGMLLWAKFKIALEVLAGFLLGLNMPQLAEAASNIVKGFFNSMKKTIENIDWAGIAQQITSFLTNLDWEGMASSVAQAANAIIKAIHDMITNTDWVGIAKTLTDGLNAFIKEVDWEEAGKTISDFMIGVLKFIGEAVKNFDWEEIGKAVGEFLSNIDWVAVATELGQIGAYLIEGLLKGMLGALRKVGEQVLKKIKALVQQIKNDFNSALSLNISSSSLSDYNARRYGNAGSINGYAEGGYPQTGEVFLARENGAELVGTIGGRTGVANNGQIVEGISEGVAYANSGVIGAINQLISVVQQIDPTVELDGLTVSRGLKKYERQVNREYGQPLAVEVGV